MVQPRDVVLIAGGDLFGLGIDGKQDRAFESMPHGQNFGQHRHALFGTIFIVAGDKDDMFSLARPFVAFVDYPGIFGRCERRHGEQDSQTQKTAGELVTGHDRFLPIRVKWPASAVPGWIAGVF